MTMQNGKFSDVSFFPSVSSVSKNILTPIQHIEILVAINHSKFLISAYDLFNIENDERSKLEILFQRAKVQNQIIMLDSGIYEKTWRSDLSWKKEDYEKICEEYNFDYTFNYDEYNQSALKMFDIQAISQNLSGSLKCPIIHTDDPDDFQDICYDISKSFECPLIAVPERELGDGIYEGLKTIKKIRNKLNSLPYYQKIHILGTGNPLSIIAYSLMGADSFDGLDWCQTVVDYDTFTLHHTQHYSFYSHQSSFGSLREMSYLVKLFAHNLSFYDKFMEQINDSKYNGSLLTLAEKYLPINAIKEVRKIYESGI